MRALVETPALVEVLPRWVFAQEARIVYTIALETTFPTTKGPQKHISRIGYIEMGVLPGLLVS